MSKKILIAILAIIGCFNNQTTTSYTVNADYTRTFTRSLPVWLSKFMLGRGMLRSWTLSTSTASLWAIPATTVITGMTDTVIKSCFPEEISKHITSPNIDEINEKNQQEQEQKLAAINIKNQSEKFNTAIATATILGTIWIANKYKNTLTSLFTNKPSIQNIIQTSTTVAQATQQIKNHGYNKIEFIQAGIQPGKFTALEIQQITASL